MRVHLPPTVLRSMHIPEHVYTLDSADLNIACEAVLAAAKIISTYWDQPVCEFACKDGENYDLVSIVDESADKAIHRVLTQHCPTDSILSEEVSPTTVCTSGRLWVVDPLDGTSSFLFRVDPSCPSVMIALMVDNVCELSVVCQPLVSTWTYALANRGAFSNGKRIRVSNTCTQIDSAWIDMNHYGCVKYESAEFLKIDSIVRNSKGGAKLVTRSAPHSAIALRLCQGCLSMCVHDHNPSHKPKQLPWDIVPIQLIITEAGGMYVDLVRGPLVPLDPFDVKGPIVIANPQLVKHLYEKLH